MARLVAVHLVARRVRIWSKLISRHITHLTSKSQLQTSGDLGDCVLPGALAIRNARSTAIFYQPCRPWAMAAHRGVRAPLQAHRPRECPLQPVPEANAVENRIQHIGHRAVMAVFGVGVMPCVMARGLQQADVLEE